MLERLPQELRNKIFDFLSADADLTRLEGVSVRLREQMIAPGPTSPWYNRVRAAIHPQAMANLPLDAAFKDVDRIRRQKLQVTQHIERLDQEEQAHKFVSGRYLNSPQTLAMGRYDRWEHTMSLRSYLGVPEPIHLRNPFFYEPDRRIKFWLTELKIERYLIARARQLTF